MQLAGVDDSVIAPGRFNLVILGDGKELIRYAFMAEEPPPAAASGRLM